ncbi:Phosphoglucomutase, first 3 domain-containing protein [Neoconidiobolus thromboides FSU 785]|nr:Phosphoglucomutase, first 3 domain-containing protein [Neoconidiobolus thromboides FSU 785]
MSTFTIQQIPTTIFDGQKPGTSGLRKKVAVFSQQHYTENFIQATLQAIPNGCQGKTLVVGGDGRYFSEEAVQKIIKIAAGNGVAKLIIGQNGILSTPAASNLIRKLKADGGILLTASHNPGGPENDFGIKYNVSNGGPAPESITDKIYEYTKIIKEYSLADIQDVDISKIGTIEYNNFIIEVIDSIEDYVQLMKEIFDFKLIQNFISTRSDFKFLFDGMHGVTGEYAQRLFIKELNLSSNSIMNCVPSPTFNNGHPDPNLTYAHELVEKVNQNQISFGAASDGDGDRNMILAYDAFVNPSDSVAIIAANSKFIPYFKKNPITGLARSMPTSTALDRVAEGLKYTCYEVPTGWKFFGNLMDANKLSICGEESFGTGSNHIREKDGLWAILAWLNILAGINEIDNTITIKKILSKHYQQFGRNYFSRYDYEEVDSVKAKNMMDYLLEKINKNEFIGQKFNVFTVKKTDNFEYTDPIDHSISKNQGLRFIFECGSRVIFRLSGTGSSGATIRMYVEKYEADAIKAEQEAPEALKPLIEAALQISKLTEFTGRKEPTVIT